MSNPNLVRFQANSVMHPKMAKVVVIVPSDTIAQLTGLDRVEGTINGLPFRAKLQQSSGVAYLLIAQPTLNKAGVKIGDIAQLIVLKPEPDTIPADLQMQFDNHPKAEQLFNNLPLMGRLDWLRWVNDAKDPKTRERRIRRTVEQLDEGKRRACCVNVYGYMLLQIAANK